MEKLNGGNLMLLSVVIPIYNVEKYLDKCLQSVVDQTYSNLDIILVNDGSTDLSGDLCEQWRQKDKRISVIHKKNGGLSSARNAGINIAKGELISFIDSDDFIELDMYETMVNAMLETRKDIACCGRIVDLWGEREKIEYMVKGMVVFSREEAIKETLLLSKIDVSACDKVYRKRLFDNIRYPEGKISEDAAIIFHLLNESNGIVHAGKPFYHYIYRKNSISKSNYTHKQYDAYINCLNTQKFINIYYPQMKKYCNIYCSLVCGNLLQNMEGNAALINKYQNDFKAYKIMFNKGYKALMWEKEISYKIKIRNTFIRLNKYLLFEKLKFLVKRSGR